MKQESSQGQERAHDGHDQNHRRAKTVIINATPYEVTEKEISYEDIVNLAYDGAPPTGENVIITVTYSRGENGKSGDMLPGDTVKVKSRMVFDVSATDRS